MAVNKKSLENLEKGKKFSSTNQPENNGRRPNVFAKYIREKASLDDIKAFISSIILYDAKEIQQILDDENDKPPILSIIYLKAMTSDMKKGELTNSEILMNRAFGKPEKTINHGVSEIPPETLTKLSMIFSEKEEPKVKINERKPRAKRKNN